MTTEEQREALRYIVRGLDCRICENYTGKNCVSVIKCVDADQYIQRSRLLQMWYSTLDKKELQGAT